MPLGSDNVSEDARHVSGTNIWHFDETTALVQTQVTSLKPQLNNGF